MGLASFVADVELRGRVIAYPDRDQDGFIRESRQSLAHLGFDLLSDGFSVDDLRGHRARLVPRFRGLEARSRGGLSLRDPETARPRNRVTPRE